MSVMEPRMSWKGASDVLKGAFVRFVLEGGL